MPTPFSDAIAALSDGTLRRLLGARAFLRGYDFVRRHAVRALEISEASARGEVAGSEPEVCRVALRLTPDGFASECSCPPFSTIDGHCKHVAAVLIALRAQARGERPSDVKLETAGDGPPEDSFGTAGGKPAGKTAANGRPGVSGGDANVPRRSDGNGLQVKANQNAYGSASSMELEGSGEDAAGVEDAPRAR